MPRFFGPTYINVFLIAGAKKYPSQEVISGYDGVIMINAAGAYLSPIPWLIPKDPIHVPQFSNLLFMVNDAAFWQAQFIYDFKMYHWITFQNFFHTMPDIIVSYNYKIYHNPGDAKNS